MTAIDWTLRKGRHIADTVVTSVGQRLITLVHPVIDARRSSKPDSPSPLSRNSFSFKSEGMATEKDLLAKYITLDDSIGAYLILDRISEDPIVQSYLSDDYQNAYMLAVLDLMTSPGDHVVDLGCHIGTFSILAAARGRRVTAVDASRFHVDLVRDAAQLNGFKNIDVQFGAVSATPGFVRFFEEGLFGRIDFDGNREGSLEVPTITLDKILDESDGPVTFLKMDIEGAEYDALLTGQSAIMRHRPAILFESNPLTLELAGRSVHDFRALLEEWEYRVFRIQGDRWVYAEVSQIQPEAWVDMIAIPNEKQQLWSDRIDWTWHDHDIVAVCKEWSLLPYHGPKEYLRRSIRAWPLSTLEMHIIADQC